MTTLNNVLNLFKDIADRHEQINDYGVKQDFDVDADRANKYPLLIVNPTNPVMPKGENGYNVINYSIELQVLDLLNKDVDNTNDVLSDTMQVITDVLLEFSRHPDYYDMGIDLLNDVTLTSLRGVYDEDATGYKCLLELQVPINRGYCTSPIITK